ncbi:holo-ACP synthase [Rhodococcus marinonascens]|uniref:holo-ACP synthase n=1 Tax=Rhodococcus marinonascens TaxID=38311 RepID=UPI0009356284|nr:holo-ACP synthase [Rhodococcus marinonascens]
MSDDSGPSTHESRIGCDVMMVEHVRSSVERFGDRYLTRIFTRHELETCGGPARDQRLAARFAAKEAVVKVLRPGDIALPWQSIEIRRESWGGCGVYLSGNASNLAERQGLGGFHVSISHEADVAFAMVTASRFGTPD